MESKILFLENDLDLEHILELKALNDCGNLNSYNRDKILHRLYNMVEGGHYFWGIKVEKDVVGFSILHEPRDANSFISKWVFIHPDFRRQGLGSKLLVAEIEFAKEYGVPILAYTHGSQICNNFYKSNGFSISSHNHPTSSARLELK